MHQCLECPPAGKACNGSIPAQAFLCREILHALHRRAAGHGARTWARSCSEQRPTRATGPEPIVMGEGAWLNAAALAADARSTHSRFAIAVWSEEAASVSRED